MGEDHGATFAAGFQGNQTIKMLIIGYRAIDRIGTVIFLEELPQDHSLEAIIFNEIGFDDDSVVSIL